jgi:hypothetical protein
MPKSKDPAKYPYAYYELVKKVDSSGIPIRLNFSTKREAQNIRLDLYGFKGALAAAGDPAAVPAARMVVRMELKMEDMTYDLIISSSLDADVNGKILEALAELEDAPSGDDNSLGAQQSQENEELIWHTPPERIERRPVDNTPLSSPGPDQDDLLRSMYGPAEAVPANPEPGEEKD